MRDGRIDVSLFERKSAEYRQERARILTEIEGFGAVDGKYVEAGIKLLELTRNMHRLLEKQQAAEKTQTPEFRRVELGLEGRRNCSGVATTLWHDCGCQSGC